MREILFRGKRTDKWNYGEWAEGYLDVFEETAFILINHDNPYAIQRVEVAADTVGQFTGLLDKNGKRIFEGDIVRNADGYLFSAQYPFAVKFCDGNFCGDAGGFVYISGEEFRYCEVIGNIHDNPELLEVDE